MSKRKDKKKDEPVVPEKYIPENLLENLTAIEGNGKENLYGLYCEPATISLLLLIL